MTPVILASASVSRARLLTAAGVVFTVEPAHVDEDAIKQSLRADGAPVSACAETLAEMKAVAISRRYPQALVIGADQMLECEGAWFDKPADLARAEEQLLTLAGKTHTLPTAAVVALGGQRIWHQIATPRLTMRRFDRAFVQGYLAEVGAAALTSVGAYQLEGRGSQLFHTVEGDFFTILGLPLLPLLAFLRAHHVVPS